VGVSKSSEEVAALTAGRVCECLFVVVMRPLDTRSRSKRDSIADLRRGCVLFVDEVSLAMEVDTAGAKVSMEPMARSFSRADLGPRSDVRLCFEKLSSSRCIHGGRVAREGSSATDEGVSSRKSESPKNKGKRLIAQ